MPNTPSGGRELEHFTTVEGNRPNFSVNDCMYYLEIYKAESLLGMKFATFTKKNFFMWQYGPYLSVIEIGIIISLIGNELSQRNRVFLMNNRIDTYI